MLKLKIENAYRSKSSENIPIIRPTTANVSSVNAIEIIAYAGARTRNNTPHSTGRQSNSSGWVCCMRWCVKEATQGKINNKDEKQRKDDRQFRAGRGTHKDPSLSKTCSLQNKGINKKLISALFIRKLKTSLSIIALRGHNIFSYYFLR